MPCVSLPPIIHLSRVMCARARIPTVTKAHDARPRLSIGLILMSANSARSLQGACLWYLVVRADSPGRSSEGVLTGPPFGGRAYRPARWGACLQARPLGGVLTGPPVGGRAYRPARWGACLQARPLGGVLTGPPVGGRAYRPAHWGACLQARPLGGVLTGPPVGGRAYMPARWGACLQARPLGGVLTGPPVGGRAYRPARWGACLQARPLGGVLSPPASIPCLLQQWAVDRLREWRPAVRMVKQPAPTLNVGIVLLSAAAKQLFARPPHHLRAAMVWRGGPADRWPLVVPAPGMAIV